MPMQRMEIHSHTHYSNFRLVDSINKPEVLINRAIEIGLMGICITDHETVANSIVLNKIQKKLKKTNPDFKVGLGNEIYLTDTRETKQKYYHFILIAKDGVGHRQLRELSSRAWLQSYSDRGMTRVPTLKTELADTVRKNPGHLIATSACIGSELGQNILAMEGARKNGNTELANEHKAKIIEYVLYCKDLFGDDFYMEVAPGANKEQIIVNKKIAELSQVFNCKLVLGCDAHYLKKEDRFVHKAYLNSKDGEREVDDFYEYSYLQTEEEIKENLINSIPDLYEIMCQNSMEIYNKIEFFDLEHSQGIPSVKVSDYPKANKLTDYPILNKMYQSDDIYDRYWVNQCVDKLRALESENGLSADIDTYYKRLEEEADIKATIGEKLNTNMFKYPITLQHYIDMFWECGSTVGAGRGSSCSGLNHYLLGVTQLDPISWDLPFWRYLNKERTELGDIDIDLCPSKRPLILQKIKEERAEYLSKDLDELSKKNLGCTLVATYGTETTKSTVLTACRGYRSEEYPNGIDVDIAQYLSSLIPQERGFVWELDDVLYGNEEKGRRPQQMFINEVNKYPGLLDIMKGISGLIKQRGSHASGVIMFDGDPYEHGCFMRTPSGEVITQYDLHTAEAAGMTKYDFLVTDIQDKITECINLLQEYNEIEPNLTLREAYEKYLAPEKLPLDDSRIWEALRNNSVINIFQFDSQVGSQAAKKIKPSTILEMADANGLMRLMTAGKGEETPMEKYIRYKNNIDLWYAEMRKYNLTLKEQKILEPYFLKSYGVPPSQEQLMRMLMDEDICGFTLAEANDARKIVGKKQMKRIPELKDKVIKKAKSKYLGEYVWKFGIGPQMGYSFSIIHALAYSFIGVQGIYLATAWNPIYWNTACLRVNSGSIVEDGSVNYAKIAMAINVMKDRDINVSLIDINKSDYNFVPNPENNEILYGLQALSNVNSELIELIKANRPFKGIKDFLYRMPKIKKPAMLSLIRGGAFDNLDKEWAKTFKGLDTRMVVMIYYLMFIGDFKTKLNLQNMQTLIKYNLLPESLKFTTQTYQFNKIMKKAQAGDYYCLTGKLLEMYVNHYDLEQRTIENINGVPCVAVKYWKNIYSTVMDKARDYINENQKELLGRINFIAFKEIFDKYAEGSIAAWEMNSLCFYYHEHELANVNRNKYGITNFKLIPNENIERYWKRNGRNIPIYKIYTIVGTVIEKNDSRSTVTLLTPDGVITVKFTKEYYAMYKRQISEVNEKGEKKIMEKGWFTRGTKLMVSGFKRDDTFVSKTYQNTNRHQLYKITSVFDNGDISMTHDRYSGGFEEDEEI